jgi:hypothetical protein
MSRATDAQDDRSQAAFVEALSHAVQDALAHALAELGRDDRGPLTVPRARTPLAPARLARTHPGPVGARVQARALYERCLALFRQRFSPAGAGADDAGIALTLFVCACIGALRDVRIDAARAERVERQMRAVLRASAWRRGDQRERQLYVEQLAIVGMLVRECAVQARQEGPASMANVQRSARGYLRQLLGIDPDRLTLGDEGLCLVDAPAVALAA